MGERFQGGYIKDATAFRLDGNGLAGQPVEAPEKGGERLAASRWGGHEDMAARGDLVPSTLLNLRGTIKRGAKPVARGRRKEIEGAPHCLILTGLRAAYKCSFRVGDLALVAGPAEARFGAGAGTRGPQSVSKPANAGTRVESRVTAPSLVDRCTEQSSRGPSLLPAGPPPPAHRGLP